MHKTVYLKGISRLCNCQKAYYLINNDDINISILPMQTYQKKNVRLK